MSFPSDRPAAIAKVLGQPRVSVPGLAVEELWLAPDAAVVATLSGPDSAGASSLLFLNTTDGSQLGALTVGSEELAVIATGWSVGASHNWRTGEISVWRPVGGEPIGRLNPHRDRGVHALALAAHGGLAASIGEEGRVALWRPTDGVVVGDFEPTSPFDLDSCALRFSPDARLLAVRTDADTVELWTTSPLQFSANLPEHGEPVFSPDGHWVAAGGPAIRLYDVRTGSAPRDLPGGAPLGFTADGRLLVVGAPDGRTTVWRTETAQPFGYLAGGGPRALSPDGQTLALTGPGTEIDLLAVGTGQITARLTGLRGEVQALAVGPGGALVVAACSDATLRVWA